MADPVLLDPCVRKPYKECPKCKQVAFGVVIVGDRNYFRRCALCGYHLQAALPPVKKAIIYLDQLVISNLMLVMSHSTKAVDPFFRTLYERLLELLRLQVIVCPSSDAHRNESIVHQSSEELRDAYEVFGHSIAFRPFEHIKYAQIADLVTTLTGKSHPAPLAARDVLYSDPNTWFDHIRVSVKPFFPAGYVDALRFWREKTAAGIADVFTNEWKVQPNQTWEHWRDREARGWAIQFLRGYDEAIVKMKGIMNGSIVPTSLDDMPMPIIGFFFSLTQKYMDTGETMENARAKVYDFFKSDEILKLPFVQIQSAMYATTAKKAPSQIKLPTQGFSTDVDAMSLLLPYCDAMFMDREVAGLWRDIQSSPKRRLPYSTKVFSMQSKAEFLTYLDELDKAIPENQRLLVDEVLG